MSHTASVTIGESSATETVYDESLLVGEIVSPQTDGMRTKNTEEVPNSSSSLSLTTNDRAVMRSRSKEIHR